MAIFRPGHVVGAISGNLGTMNFANGPYGPYVRKRMVRTDKRSVRQLASRVQMQTIRHEWSGLSKEQRTTWRAAARQFPQVNRLGIRRNLSGFQFFVRVNIPNLLDKWELLTTPPLMTPSPPVYNLEWAITLPDFYLLTWDCELAPLDYHLRIFTSRSVADRNVLPVKHWRHTLTYRPPVEIQNLKTFFISQWGPAVAGEFLSVRVQTRALYALRSQFTQVNTFAA